MNFAIVTDQQVAELADIATLIGSMDEVFVACAQARVDNYPFVRSLLRGTDNIFGIKAGCNYNTRELGLKCGGYWLENSDQSLDRHQSTVLLLDIDTGQPTALVAGNTLTALRTAAAAAAAARRLARPDASRVALLGTGRQALYQLKALLEVRSIRSVTAWSRSPSRVDAFGEEVRRLGLDFEAAPTPGAATRGADIIVTVTPSTTPLIHVGDVSPGAHINAMGSDTLGKRELSQDLLEAGRIWTDDIEQAGLIGECQHLPNLETVSHLGDLIGAPHPPPRADDDITIFDGTGLALQDLAAARLILSLATGRGSALTVSL